MAHYDDVNEQRIDVIGQNGNDGLHYQKAAAAAGSLEGIIGQAVKLRRPMPLCLQKQPLSVQLLDKCKQVQEQRGIQYDCKPGVVGGSMQAERSFQRVATAFNAITGKNLRGSEVALLQQILKDVRQWSNIDQLHIDSLVDGTSYSSLKAEELMREHGVGEDLPDVK